MVATVVKTIGTGGDYTTLASWEAGVPANLTTSNRWTAGTFSGTFTAGETVTGTGITGGKFLASDGSTYITFGTTTTPAGGITVTGSTSGATCVLTALTDTGIIWQGQIKAATDAFSSATNLLTISGSTVSATCYVELTTATGASFRDNASVQSNALKFNSSNGCAITLTGSYTQAIIYSQDFCRFSNLQINSTGTLGAGNYPIKDSLGSGSATIDINNCILETVTAGAVAIYGSGARIRNSLCVVRASSKANIALIQNGAKAVNCTFVVPSDKTAATNFFDVGNYGGSTSNLENCAFFGATNLKTGSATPTYTTCYTDMASPPTGATTATYNTTQFVNITDATRDYRIPTGSAMKDTGTTDSTYAATDIAGTARPSGSAYDVGCWEFVAAAANVYNPLSGRGGTVANIFVNR